MDFSLSDIGGSGWGTVAENFGDGNGDTGSDSITSALAGLGINIAAGAASVGLQTLAQSQGVQAAYPLGYNAAMLPRPALSSPMSGTVVVGALLVGGLLLYAVFWRKKG
jgi:hypothetical protein